MLDQMTCKMGKIGRISWILLSFLLTLTLNVFGQKPSVQLSVNKKPIEVGQVIAFTVKSNVNGSVDINVPETFMQGGTMNGMEQTIDNNGNMVVSINFTLEGMFKKEGKYTILATVKEKNKIHKSNPLTITVKKKSDPKAAKKFENTEEEITKHNMKEAVFGIIEKSSQKVYEGQPLILAAKVYSRLSISLMQAYKTFTLKGAAETFDLEKSDNLSLNRENFQGTTFLTFSCGKQLVFPASPGKYVIKPFSMVLRYNTGGFFDRDLQLESNATFVDVLPLPKGAPKDFIGAVGKFELATNVSKKTGKVGDIISVEMTVSGTGNLHTISKPKLDLPAGLTLYGDPEIKEELDYTDEGVTGYKKYHFHLKVNQAGEIDLPALSISYFDPTLKKYVRLSENATHLSIEGEVKGQEVQVADSAYSSTSDEVIAKPVKGNDSNTDEPIPYANTCIVFLLLLVVVLATLLIVKNKRKQQQVVEYPVENTIEVQPIHRVQTVDFSQEVKRWIAEDNYAQAYATIHKHLPKTLLVKVNETTTDVTLDTLVSQLELQHFPTYIIDDYQFIMRTCEQTMYAYEDKTADWKEVYTKTQGILNYLNT
jgi:hypothetical protein